MDRITKILLWVAVYGITALFVLNIHNAETARRGYEAIGGEFTLFLVPLIVYIAINTLKQWRKPTAAEQKEDDSKVKKNE